MSSRWFPVVPGGSREPVDPWFRRWFPTAPPPKGAGTTHGNQSREKIITAGWFPREPHREPPGLSHVSDAIEEFLIGNGFEKAPCTPDRPRVLTRGALTVTLPPATKHNQPAARGTPMDTNPDRRFTDEQRNALSDAFSGLWVTKPGDELSVRLDDILDRLDRVGLLRPAGDG